MFLDEFPHMQASSAAASASTAKEKVPRSQQGNLWGASGGFLQFFLQNMDGLNKIKPFTATVNNMEKHDWTNKNCDLSHGDQQYVTACPTTRTANLLLVMAKTKWPWHMGIHFGMLHLRPIIKRWFMHSYGGHFEKQSFSDKSTSFVHLLHPYHP